MTATLSTLRFRLLTVLLLSALPFLAYHFRSSRAVLTIAVIPKTTGTDYWESMHVGVRDAASKKGTHVLWNAPQSEADYAEQASMVEDAIRQKVGGIILAPEHEYVLASAVRHAKAEGIPVVIVDSPIAVTPDRYLEYVASDDVEIGQIAADRIGAVLGGSGEIAVVGVSPTIKSSTVRERAFMDRIKSQFPGLLTVDVRYGLSDAARSQTLTLDMLKEHPDLSGIFASDPFSTRGVSSGLGRAQSKRHVILVGVAQELDMLEKVRGGSIDSLVVQDPYQMGYLAIQTMERGQRVHSGPDNTVQTKVDLATKDNLDTNAIRRFWSHYDGNRQRAARPSR